MERTFTTTLIWHDSTGNECEAAVRVTYVGRKGFAGDQVDPPEPASVDIVSIVSTADPRDQIPDRLREDDALIDECFEHWTNDEIEAAESREQSRRDALMEGF